MSIQETKEKKMQKNRQKKNQLTIQTLGGWRLLFFFLTYFKKTTPVLIYVALFTTLCKIDVYKIVSVSGFLYHV